MPEPAAWRYQKITKPMFDLPTQHRVLTGRVLTMAGDIIEDGFVEIRDGEIVAVGRRGERGGDDAPVEETGGTIMPGMINSHFEFQTERPISLLSYCISELLR